MRRITSSGFVNRNIIEYLTTDKRVRQYRCNTLQNPLAYYDGTRLLPVSITDVASTVNSKSEGIYLRDKNIVSVGLKQADDAYKFIGFRPDEKQDGSEQLEFSLESIEVNGKPQTIDLSTKMAISSISTNLGPLVVQSRRQGCRIMLPLTNADEGFKVSLRMHLTGLTVEHIEPLDEYWIFNEKGQFRFRLGKPYLVDPMTMDVLHCDEYGRYDDLVKHYLKDLGGGEYLYVKEPTEAFGKVALPERFLIDADTKYSTTADGWVRSYGTSWADVRAATTGNQGSGNSDGGYSNCMLAQYYSPNYYFGRSFFYYALSGLSGTVTVVSEYIRGVANNGSSVSSQQGTQADTLGADDFDSFSGSSFGNTTAWSQTGWNQITYSSDGMEAVESVLGGTYKSCLREYSKDYLNVTASDLTAVNGCWFADETGIVYDPYLSITVTAAGQPTIKRFGGIPFAKYNQGIW